MSEIKAVHTPTQTIPWNRSHTTGRIRSVALKFSHKINFFLVSTMSSDEENVVLFWCISKRKKRSWVHPYFIKKKMLNERVLLLLKKWMWTVVGLKKN